MQPFTLSVSQLNEYVRKTLASDPMLRNLCLMGEISNFKRHASGHWYFSLKDEESTIQCAMFRQATFGVKMQPQNGQKVRLFGNASLYTKTGSYQFYAEFLEADGVGELHLRFEALKEKLLREGLFDPSIKKTLPLLPKGVGIVTSETGAVIHDIMRVAKRRCPSVPLYLCPCKVQGVGAGKSIVKAIQKLDQTSEVDVIIVGRGGGSLEDLWAFNEEIVARAIVACKKPIISAVGHETDTTIADFVADVRAATPSVAAEIAVPDALSLLQTIESSMLRMKRAMISQITTKQVQLHHCVERMERHSPRVQLQIMSQKISHLTLRMQMSAEKILTQKERMLEKCTQCLLSSSPVKTMQRGYAIVMSGDQAVRSIEDIKQGAQISIRLHDGVAKATIDQTAKEKFPCPQEK